MHNIIAKLIYSLHMLVYDFLFVIIPLNITNSVHLIDTIFMKLVLEPNLLFY